MLQFCSSSFSGFSSKLLLNLKYAQIINKTTHAELNVTKISIESVQNICDKHNYQYQSNVGLILTRCILKSGFKTKILSPLKVQVSAHKNDARPVGVC